MEKCILKKTCTCFKEKTYMFSKKGGNVFLNQKLIEDTDTVKSARMGK